MTAPAASSQLGWLLKHLDAMTDAELWQLYREVGQRLGGTAATQAEWSKAFAGKRDALLVELRGGGSTA